MVSLSGAADESRIYIAAKEDVVRDPAGLKSHFMRKLCNNQNFSTVLALVGDMQTQELPPDSDIPTLS